MLKNIIHMNYNKIFSQYFQHFEIKSRRRIILQNNIK